MIRTHGAIILTAFLLGWVTYAFSLFNVERFSITLLLVASFVIAIFGFRLATFFSVSTVLLLASGLLAWAVALFSYFEIEKAFTHLIQHLLTIGVLVGSQSVDWEKEFPRFRKVLAWIAAIVLLYAVYQYFARVFGFPFAFLPITNNQIGGDEGMQRGVSNVLLGADRFTRVSSFFAEPSDLGRFMLWILAVGYACAKGRLRLALMGMGLAGVLISQSMGGVVGVLFLVIVVTTMRRGFRRALLFLCIGAVMLAALAHFFPQAAETLRTRVELIAIEREGRLLQRGRFADMEDNCRIILDAPYLGYGLASLKEIAPENVISSAIELLLLERGVLGASLFFAPFLWALARLALAGSTRDEMQDTALMILVVEMYCFATFAMIYFQPIYLALGFALYCSRGRPYQWGPDTSNN